MSHRGLERDGPGGLTSPQYAVLTVLASYPHANLGAIGRAASVARERRGGLIELLARVAYPDPVDLPPDPTPGAPLLGLADTLTHLLWRAEQRSQRIWREIVGKTATPAQYAVFCALRRDRLDQRTHAAGGAGTPRAVRAALR